MFALFSLMVESASIRRVFFTHRHTLSEFVLSAIFGRRRSAWDNKPPPRFCSLTMLDARARERAEEHRMNFQRRMI
jgi:hypothetical protein